MPEFRKKPVTVHAEQFTDPASPPKGVVEIEAGTFAVVTIQDQIVHVKPGEWIIRESDGVHYYPCADAEFTRLYEPADAPLGFAKVFGHGMDQVLVSIAPNDDDEDWHLRFETQVHELARMSANLNYVDEEAARSVLGKVDEALAFAKRDALRAEFAQITKGSVL